MKFFLFSDKVAKLEIDVNCSHGEVRDKYIQSITDEMREAFSRIWNAKTIVITVNDTKNSD